jgi:hypothetical protein
MAGRINNFEKPQLKCKRSLYTTFSRPYPLNYKTIRYEETLD